MKGLFLNSFIIGRLLLPMAALTGTAYRYSRLRGFLLWVKACWHNSCCYRLLRAYLYKPPYFEYSLTYYCIHALVRAMGSPLRWAGRYMVWLGYYSRHVRAVKAYRRANSAGRLAAVAVVLMFLGLGYGLGLIISGAITPVGLGSAAALGLTGIFLMYLALHYRCLRRSLVYRLCKNIIRVK